MKTLTAKELMEALRQKTELTMDEDKPDMTYSEPEPRLEPSAMPSGEGAM